MSEENTIVVRVLADGTSVEVLPDGATRPMPPDETDWQAVGRLTDDEINAAARTDPDNPPSEDYAPGRMRPVGRVHRVRFAMRMSREEFSLRFHIPIETLRDWETGKTEPDEASKAYLHVIETDPEAVARAFQARTMAAE